MIMSDLTPLQDQAVDVLSVVLAITLFVGLILWIIYSIIKKLKTDKARKEFNEYLTEHDKAIIKDYENLEWNPFKKKEDFWKK